MVVCTVNYTKRLAINETIYSWILHQALSTSIGNLIAYNVL